MSRGASPWAARTPPSMKAMRRYANARRPPSAPRAATRHRVRTAVIAAALSLGAERGVLEQPDRHTLSGSQRRQRIGLARILFRGTTRCCCSTSRPNHLDADSDLLAARLPEDLQGRLRRHLARREARRILREQGLPPGREPQRHRHLQRRLEGLPGAARGGRAAAQAFEAGQNAREEGPETLFAQADKMQAKATKTVAAQNMAKRRAERLLDGLGGSPRPRTRSPSWRSPNRRRAARPR